MKKNLLNKKKKGFTLIELIVVIAIIGVLAAVAIPSFTGQANEAKLKADQATARNIAMAVQTEVAKGTTITDDATAKTAIASYFNGTVPTPQSGGTFTVVISGDSISVTDGSKDSPKQLYPAED